jgi:hypothetical protein
MWGLSDQNLASVKFVVSLVVNAILQGFEFFIDADGSSEANLGIFTGISGAIDTGIEVKDFLWIWTTDTLISVWPSTFPAAWVFTGNASIAYMGIVEATFTDTATLEKLHIFGFVT